MDDALMTSGANRFMSWATWPAAVALIVVVLVVRMVYLVWLSPYELAGDEAYYWECSRHLSLCYYEKGPGLAWVLAGFCRLLGDSEWVIRLPVALSSAAAAWMIGRLAMSIAGGDARVGFVAVVIFICIPAFQANAQICTQDGPTILLWAMLTAWGLRWVQRWHANQLRLRDTLLMALLLGVAFLFKQSALLFLAGPAMYVIIERRRLPWSTRLIAHAIAASLIFALTISPMIIWNQQHGWPTLSHTLGHLGAPGGDHDAGKDDHFSLLWPMSLIGAQLGAVGIPALAAMVLACAWAWRDRRAWPEQWPAHLWLICCSMPAIAFFIGLSFIKPVLGGWPFPSYVPLVALVAAFITMQRRSAFPLVLRCTIIYGIGGWLLLSFPNVLPKLPVVGPKFEKSVMKRISGHRQRAAALQAIIDATRDDSDRPPLVITRYYMDAALDAFYLPGHPQVFNAGAMTGQRPTSYDFWPSNDLSSPALLGRSAVMDGVSPTHPWEQVLRFDSIRPAAGVKIFQARDYRGVAR
jgi:4-amino-4-deoxy-L-arabinose transferase-like glycosyltransferase